MILSQGTYCGGLEGAGKGVHNIEQKSKEEILGESKGPEVVRQEKSGLGCEMYA